MARSAREISCCVAVLLAACSARPAFALDPRYPDWPCQQLKVPEISIASVWAGPPIEAADKGKPLDPKEAELVARLAARRTPMEDARKLIADFVVGTKEEKLEKAKTLFAALYATLNAQRDEVMNGIERFSRKQKAMAEEIREQARKMREAQDAPNADPAQASELASQLSWQTRIFDDRRKSTAYVCERAGPDREAAVRSGKRDSERLECRPAGQMKNVCRPGQIGYSSGRGSGLQSCSGSKASNQPSVPSGYHTTLE